MFAKLLLVACLVDVAWADGHKRDCCSPGDKSIVQEQWGRLWSSSDSGKVKIIMGRMVFTKLFEVAPALKELFKGVNVDDMDSAEFQSHTVRVLNGLDIVINLLHDEDSAKAQLAHLAQQHADRDGITASHFKVLGQIMLEGLGNIIPDFAYDSWESCFGVTANGITAGLPA